MKWIRSYKLYTESKSQGNSSKVVTELCIAMLLINPNFLDKILDQGQKSRYTENSLVFVNDLRNLLFGNNRLRVGSFNKEINKFEESNELSVTNNYFSNLTDGFDIEKDWNKLVKSRILSRSIQDKVLITEKLNPEDIKFVYWIGPNKDRGDKEDLVIELNGGEQFPIALNSKMNLSKTKSFNSLIDILLGEERSEKLFTSYIGKWDKLTQEWVRIIYENAKKPIQLHIEKFIDPDRIYSITWEDYFNYKHMDKKYQYLGEYLPEFDKNILKLSKLMTTIYKNPDVSFDNPQEVKDEWDEIKTLILNSNIIEHLFTETFQDIMDEDEIERDGDNFIPANGKMKERLMKVILDLLGAKEIELNYLHSNHYYKIPPRQYFRDNYDNFRLKFDYHVELTSEGEEDRNDSQFDIKVDLNGDELLDIDLRTGWSGGEMSGKLSTKIKLDFSDKYNLIISENYQKVNENSHYDDTSWTMDIDGKEETITIQEIQDYLKDEPVVEIPLEDISYMGIHKDKTDEETIKRSQKSNLDFPIIISKKGDEYTMILDGHHRLKKATDNNVKTIKAKILDLDRSPNIYKKMFT